MATCLTCKYYRPGYRAGAERQWQWTAESTPGVPLPYGRCEIEPPRPGAQFQTGEAWGGWPRCHEGDYCGKWEAIPA